MSDLVCCYYNACLGQHKFKSPETWKSSDILGNISVKFRFYNKFLKYVNKEDFYLFIVTTAQEKDFLEDINFYNIQDCVHAKYKYAGTNRRYQSLKGNLRWYILKFNSEVVVPNSIYKVIYEKYYGSL